MGQRLLGDLADPSDAFPGQRVRAPIERRLPALAFAPDPFDGAHELLAFRMAVNMFVK